MLTKRVIIIEYYSEDHGTDYPEPAPTVPAENVVRVERGNFRDGARQSGVTAAVLVAAERLADRQTIFTTADLDEETKRMGTPIVNTSSIGKVMSIAIKRGQYVRLGYGTYGPAIDKDAPL